MRRHLKDRINGVAELKYESGCRDVALLRLYKDLHPLDKRAITLTSQRCASRDQRNEVERPTSILTYSGLPFIFTHIASCPMKLKSELIEENVIFVILSGIK